eukprot:CAMPEP_0197599222 /NCGR_PEP_ID=MMETSP1326-20131121/30916_1 /TAXON_ID=1155430 /ORGANISM="Genus nov. species nov., Strain RCC2288" /LENGTH=119 /DNA_ID=CAMNT_0043166151 /DNA_START=28 /DNA_END=384 /DNA_ORIENTATION=+
MTGAPTPISSVSVSSEPAPLPIPIMTSAGRASNAALALVIHAAVTWSALAAVTSTTSAAACASFTARLKARAGPMNDVEYTRKWFSAPSFPYSAACLRVSALASGSCGPSTTTTTSMAA